MARTSSDASLDTRAARRRLTPRVEPYWRNIQQGRAIGYRRAVQGKGGTWIARHYDPKTKKRRYEALGAADDFLDADQDDSAITFAQAQDAARSWFAELARTGGHNIAPVTVGAALDNYLADYVTRGGKSLADTRTTIDAHIRPALGHRLVRDLTPATLTTWLRGLANAPVRVRRKKGVLVPAARGAPNRTPEAMRSRRATANRVLTTLKAALNLAFREGQVPSDDAWRRVAPFRDADAAVVRYLEDVEIERLLRVADPDFRALVLAAILTGCRYGELTSLQARDVGRGDAAHTLTIRSSKSGKARFVTLTDQAVQFFADLARDHAPTDTILCRSDGRAWGKSEQFRPMAKACEAAEIVPAASFHILRHTHASRLALAGTPLAVIAAQLGHADLKMTSKHYAHLSPGYVSETIREAFRPIGMQPEKVEFVSLDNG